MGGRRHSPGDLGSVSVPLCGPAVPRHRSPRGPGDVPLLLQTANGNVEAKVVCFYRRRDISSTLIALADKHASESSLPGRPPCPPRGQLSAPGGWPSHPCAASASCAGWCHTWSPRRCGLGRVMNLCAPFPCPSLESGSWCVLVTQRGRGLSLPEVFPLT